MLLLSLTLAAALEAAGPAPGLARPTDALECPVALDLGDPARARLARDLSRALTERETDEALQARAQLFADHGFNTAETTNSLVTAYCPIVARDRSLNAYEKTLRVRDFAARVDAAILSPGSDQ